MQRPPRINDISTDRDRPPQFWVRPPRRATYDVRKLRAPTERAYGELTNLALPAPPQETYRRAMALAAARGWRIAAQDESSLRMQAVAITRLLRFRDDIVVEVRPAPLGGGSVVAMRSKSRLGRGDCGANARRIREFLSDLARI